MAWVWTLVGALGLAFAAATLLAAVAVYASGPRRVQNRVLATILLLQSAAAASAIGLMYLTDDPRDTYAWQAVGFVVAAPFPWLYVAFLSTLPGPYARVLMRIRPAAYALAALSCFVFFLSPEAFIASIVPGEFSPWNITGGPGVYYTLWPGIVAGLLGLLVAIVNLRDTLPGTTERAQARAYVAAFAVLDLKTIGVPVTYAVSSTWGAGLIYAEVALALLFVALLAYGILRAQLLGIDVKIRFAISKSTIAAVFIAVFFIASEAAQQFFGDQFESSYLGILAAGALVFAIAPLSRVADRLAEKAVPLAAAPVAAPSAGAVEGRRAVFADAVRRSLRDGAVTREEETYLARLATELGLDYATALGIRHDVEAERTAGGQ